MAVEGFGGRPQRPPAGGPAVGKGLPTAGDGVAGFDPKSEPVGGTIGDGDGGVNGCPKIEPPIDGPKIPPGFTPVGAGLAAAAGVGAGMVDELAAVEGVRVNGAGFGIGVEYAERRGGVLARVIETGCLTSDVDALAGGVIVGTDGGVGTLSTFASGFFSTSLGGKAGMGTSSRSSSSSSSSPEIGVLANGELRRGRVDLPRPTPPNGVVVVSGLIGTGAATCGALFSPDLSSFSCSGEPGGVVVLGPSALPSSFGNAVAGVGGDDETSSIAGSASSTISIGASNSASSRSAPSASASPLPPASSSSSSVLNDSERKETVSSSSVLSTHTGTGRITPIGVHSASLPMSKPVGNSEETPSGPADHTDPTSTSSYPHPGGAPGPGSPYGAGHDTNGPRNSPIKGDASDAHSRHTTLGAIVGGVVGGVLSIVLILFITWYRKRLYRATRKRKCIRPIRIILSVSPSVFSSVTLTKAGSRPDVGRY